MIYFILLLNEKIWKLSRIGYIGKEVVNDTDQWLLYRFTWSQHDFSIGILKAIRKNQQILKK